MKVVSWNVNGLRAVHKKGFFDFVEAQNVDAICLQEIKVDPAALKEPLLHPKGYNSYFNPAQKAGYSGVAIYAKKEPLSISTAGIGLPEADREGRWIETEFKDYILVSSYFPNSQRDHARLPFKLEFCARATARLEELRHSGKNIVICGDFNVAHSEIDLRNPKTNTKNAGFLPEERAWMNSFIQQGYVDTFRKFEKGSDHYTWWSYRPGVREKNIGWRLDYFFTNEEFSERLKSVVHLPEVTGSDHCPILLTLKK